jgi:Zn-finger nucleic acid-binding protein
MSSRHSRFPTPEDRMVIGKRKDGAAWRKTPREIVPFQSALTGPVTCPQCRASLELHHNLWQCASCDGVFVETAALEAMAADLTKEPWQLPAATGPAGARPCPACSAAMIVEPFAAVAIDRCDPHGVWFDHGELASALADIAEPPSTGLAAWISRVIFAIRP